MKPEPIAAERFRMKPEPIAAERFRMTEPVKCPTVAESDALLDEHYASVQVLDADGVDISEKRPLPVDITDSSDE